MTEINPIKTPLIRLSQGQLNLLETCPPQFQRVYLEQLAPPVSPEQYQKLSWGSQFHQLMQQGELGLPIDSLLAEDEELHHAINALKATAPELWQPQENTWREAEHTRQITFGGYVLTGVYDLLILEKSEAKIIDWKTYLQPEDSTKLALNWQTRLYLYLLAETTDYPLETLSMTYWFVKLPTQPKCLTFSYNQTQHEKTRQDLTKLLSQLDQWLEDYINDGVDFPHLCDCQTRCPYYAISEVNFHLKNLQKQDRLKSIDEIEEIAL
ncbi:conserved hypothetical protein [Gloeothece citriformis PCC 7424]|uniref:PD-(D/E)XK endonuclease-like domain-containing protein n=1 Tax=Gloeothece citriformis (strain PCC 7424) TaxID=65393 RepID=B7KE02_GLOC7|nr:PD-(D/E)XK nuclease family protein [Gloeothece citriformis]ACK71700.1 conserved hypothetical protein [Gloeothece citriformis PCC 7424]